MIYSPKYLFQNRREILDKVVKNTKDKVAAKAPAKKEQKPAAPIPERVPEAPYGMKISGILKEGIEYYWKKPELANGYEIFRGYSAKGPFYPIALLTKRTVGTYIDGEFDHAQKKVYYAIRSYLDNDDGTRVYSEMSKATAAEFRSQMTLEREATYLYAGKTRSIHAFYGWGEVEDCVWSSDNESVATVSADGVITAVATGVCTLQCTSASVGQTAFTKVEVNRKAEEPLSEIHSRYSFDAVDGCWKNPHARTANDAVIVMVGDMMCGKRQMEVQYSDKEGWNFNESFTFLRELTEKSDLAVGNLETLLASGWPYMTDEVYIDNKNNCNVPARYLDAVRFGGFDVVVMSNNHNCDGGQLALRETMEQVEKYQLAYTGVFRDQTDKRFVIVEVNGMKIGYLSYMSRHTGFNGKDADWPEEDKDTMLNVFSFQRAKKDVEDCRAAGAEYVISYMHWGQKNFRAITKAQEKEAREMAEAGADYIVGSNPHLVQVYDVLTTEDGREVPCFYSVGNFLAVMNQVPGNRDSVMVKIRLQRNASGKVELKENGYIPYHTYTKCDGKYLTPVALSAQYNTELRKKDGGEYYRRIVKAVGDKVEVL